MSELRDRIQETIAREPVIAFVKGTHEQAYCGNSERAMQAPIGIPEPKPLARHMMSALIPS